MHKLYKCIQIYIAPIIKYVVIMKIIKSPSNTTIHRIATTTVRVRFAQQHLRPVAETGFSPSAAPVT